MYYVEVTLANGARVSGVLNARNERHAIAQVRNTVQGKEARAVVATRAY
jgi:hypothetical protein